MVTAQGLVANAVVLPAGSATVALTSFWPWLNTTDAKVAMPVAKAGAL